LSRFILQTIEEFSKFSALAGQAITNHPVFTLDNSQPVCMKTGIFFAANCPFPHFNPALVFRRAFPPDSKIIKHNA
jgi:hypothetical protein